MRPGQEQDKGGTGSGRVAPPDVMQTTQIFKMVSKIIKVSYIAIKLYKPFCVILPNMYTLLELLYFFNQIFKLVSRSLKNETQNGNKLLRGKLSFSLFTQPSTPSEGTMFTYWIIVQVMATFRQQCLQSFHLYLAFHQCTFIL